MTDTKKRFPLLILSAVLFFLIICPLVTIFVRAVITDGRLDFGSAWQTLTESKNAEMILNSLLLGAAVTVLSTIIAAPLAYLFTRTSFAKYRFFDIIFMIPFMTPPYIASMGWILFMQKRGLLQQLLPFTAGCEKIFFTFGGLTLVMSLHVFPFMLTILKNATVAPIEFGKSAALASVLVGICLGMWLLQNYITARKSYALVGGKGGRLNIAKLSLPARVLGWIYIIAVMVISIGVPYFSVISTSLINLRGVGFKAGNFTFQHYIELFTENKKGIQAIMNSFILAVSAATICAILGTLIVIAVRNSKSKLKKAVEAMGLLPEMLPGIVLVIGIMLFWNKIYKIIPLYNTFGIMILAYVVLFLPYTIQYVTSSFTQISNSLISAGQVFGGSPFYIFRRITLPLISKGVLTGWMMTFIIAFRELVTASLIAPPNTLVVSTYIVREFEQGSVSIGMAMAVLCVLFTTTALLILNTVIDRQKGR